MTSLNEHLKPYLARAVYDWCVDNALRPLLVVRLGGCSQLPKEFSDGFKIALDLSAAAVRGLEFNGPRILFSTCFGRQVRHLDIHIEDVIWIGSPLRGVGLALGTDMQMADEPIGESKEGKEIPEQEALELEEDHLRLV